MDDGVSAGLLILRVMVGIVMLAHGYNHIFRGGKIAGHRAAGSRASA